MQIVRDLAGYSWGRSDLMRRAMSKKDQKKIDAERKNFVYGNYEEILIAKEKQSEQEKRRLFAEEQGLVFDEPPVNIPTEVPGCVKNGIPEETANIIYDKMVDFAKYAFNKSHATAYSVTSYWTAYLKCNYPEYYLCNVMNYTEKVSKLADIIEDARDFGVKVLPPDINKSEKKFDVFNGDILFGLSNIKDVGSTANKIIIARNEKPFEDIKDFLLRGHENASATQALIDAGAFDCMGYERSEISLDNPVMQDIMKLLDIVKKKSSFIENAKKVQGFVDEYTDVSELKKRISSENLSFQITSKSVPTKESIERRILSASDAIKEALKEMYAPENEICPFSNPETDKSKLLKEKEVLGLFLTGHPIDSFSVTTPPISDVIEGKQSVSGIITGVKVSKSKKNGKEFASFTIEDRTGNISAIMFNDAYSKYSDAIIENAALILTGNVEVDEFNSTEEGISYKMIVKNIKTLKEKEKEYRFIWNDELEFIEKITEIRKSCAQEDGHKLYHVFKNHADDMYLDTTRVSRDVLVYGASII